jgi:predicted DsbA family dithiol-disulfide isomerase
MGYRRGGKLMKIKMFTKTVCPTCKIAKQQLSFLPVPVEIEEINIETDKVFEGTTEEMDAQSYLVDCLDSMSTPTFLFEDGTVVRGFEVGPIMEKLGL